LVRALLADRVGEILVLSSRDAAGADGLLDVVARRPLGHDVNLGPRAQEQPRLQDLPVAPAGAADRRPQAPIPTTNSPPRGPRPTKNPSQPHPAISSRHGVPLLALTCPDMIRVSLGQLKVRGRGETLQESWKNTNIPRGAQSKSLRSIGLALS